MARSLRLFSLPFLIFAAAYAHDFYLLPDQFLAGPGTLLRVALHNGDSFPGSEVAPVLARLKDPQLTGLSGTAAIGDLTVLGKETVGTVRIPGSGSFLLSAHTLPHFIELAPDKFLEYLREEGLEDVIAWRGSHAESGKPGRERYSKFAKALVQSGKPDESFRRVLGFPLELIPLENPDGIQIGRSLPVSVLFRGKPARGYQVEVAWSSAGKSGVNILGRTDANGRIAVPIDRAGKWRLHTLHMERCAEPAAADWESFWASFTFASR